MPPAMTTPIRVQTATITISTYLRSRHDLRSTLEPPGTPA